MKRFGILMFAVSLLALGVLSGIDTPAAYADFKFGEAVNLGPTVNLGSADYMAVMSPDGLELYFCSNRAGGYGGTDIWVTKRAGMQDPWGPPENLGSEINMSSGYDEPGSMSADGLTLHFDSGWGIYTTTRATRDAPWGPPVSLGPTVVPSTSYLNGMPVVSADGLELFFASGRPGGSGGGDIWVSARATPSDPWGTPVNLGPTVNSPSGIEGPTWISPDGLMLLFLSDRPGGFGNIDMWMITRPSKGSAWGPPRNLGRSINTSYANWVTAFSSDGRLCYISEYLGPRPGGFGGSDIWQASIEPIVDFNHDGKVDIEDLVRMIESWGKNDPSVDIGPYAWGDGKVDANDLEVLMSYWGQEVDVFDPSMIAHWAFDESEGSVAADSLGISNATLSGNPAWQPAGGKVGGALLFDGIDDCVKTPGLLNPSMGAFSVFAWVNGGAPGQMILSQMGKANWLSIDATTGWLITELKAQGSAGTTLQSQSVVTDGNWHHVGLAWDGANRILYVDDAEVAADTQPSLAGGATNLNIGAGSRLSKGTFWSGLIDDVRIYNRVVKP